VEGVGGGGGDSSWRWRWKSAEEAIGSSSPSNFPRIGGTMCGNMLKR
jgi:hypothetical protein